MIIYPFRLWFFLASDVDKPIGGVKQIYRIAEASSALGVTSTIIQQSSSFRPSWFASEIATISLSNFQQLELDERLDILVIPETMIDSSPALFPGIPRIILNQNFAYTFGLGSSRILLPSRVSSFYNSCLHVLSISHYDFSFLKNSFRLPDSRLTRLVNPIETKLFSSPKKKFRQIAFMPRKNSKHSYIIIDLLKNHPLLKGWTFVEISGLTQVEVASAMKDSAIFLSFGHPEGFGLPVAEALASACFVVGYSGIGGKELFKLASQYSAATEIEFGDWNHFLTSVLDAVGVFTSDKHLLIPRVIACSKHIRSVYSQASLVQTLSEAFDKISKTLSASH